MFFYLHICKKSSTFADFFTRAHNAAHTLGVHVARITKPYNTHNKQ